MTETPSNDSKLLTLDDILQSCPWFGRSRRDGERHRAGLLRACAWVAVVAGAVSFLFFPAALIGLTVGLMTWRVACRDLDKMGHGLMDQEGYHGTEKARSDSHAGVMLCLMNLAFWLVIFSSFASACLWRR